MHEKGKRRRLKTALKVSVVPSCASTFEHFLSSSVFTRWMKNSKDWGEISSGAPAHSPFDPCDEVSFQSSSSMRQRVQYSWTWRWWWRWWWWWLLLDCSKSADVQSALPVTSVARDDGWMCVQSISGGPQVQFGGSAAIRISLQKEEPPCRLQLDPIPTSHLAPFI